MPATNITISGVPHIIKEMGRNIHSGRMVYLARPIGKRGRPLKKHAPCVQDDDGTYRLTASYICG